MSNIIIGSTAYPIMVLIPEAQFAINLSLLTSKINYHYLTTLQIFAQRKKETKNRPNICLKDQNRTCMSKNVHERDPIHCKKSTYSAAC